jgi:hypothetical protein
MLAKIMIDKRLLAVRRVTEALRNYLRRRKQMKIVALFGTIDFDPKHDYKKQRNRR